MKLPSLPVPDVAVLELFTSSVGYIEGRIGQNIIGFEVFVFVIMKCITQLDPGVDSADRQVHLRQFVGRRVTLLAIDRDIPDLTPMRFDKLLTLHEHPSATAAPVIDASFIGFQHLHQ